MRQSFSTLLRSAFLLTLLAGMAPSTSHAGTNLLANPGFEAGGGGYTGWFTFGGGVQLSTPATDNIIRNGVAAAKIYGGFVGCPGTPSFSVCGFGQAFSPSIGKTYQFSGYTFVSSVDPITGADVCNNNRVLAKIVFFDRVTGGTEIQSNEIVLASTFTPKNQWIPFTVSTVAPTGALRVEADILYLQPGCANGSAFLDDLVFEQNPTALDASANLLANPGFSAGLGSWTTFGNVFQDARSLAIHSRPGAAKLFSTFVAGAPSGLFQHIAAAPGNQFEFGAYAQNSCQDGPITGTNDNFITEKLTFRDAVNNDIGSVEAVLADNTSPLGTWQRKAITATAPVGTVAVDTYMLFISPSLFGGSFFVDDLWLRRLDVAGVNPSPTSTLALAAPAPNPFTGSTRVDYTLPQRSAVDLAVYDITGRHIATLFKGVAEAGSHVGIWDGRASDGRLAPAGVYRAVLNTAAGRQSRSLVLSR